MNTLTLSSSLYENMYGIKISQTPERNNKIDYGGKTRSHHSKGGHISTTDKISHAARYAADTIDEFSEILNDICSLTSGNSITLICKDLADLATGIVNCDSIINGLSKVSDMSSKLRRKLEDGLDPLDRVLDSATDLLGSASNALNVFYKCFQPSPDSLLGTIFNAARGIVDFLYGVVDLGSDVLNSVYGLIADLDRLVQDAVNDLLNDIDDGLNAINSSVSLLCQDALMNPFNMLSPLNIVSSYRQVINPLINF